MKTVFCAVQLKKVACERDGFCKIATAEVSDICSVLVKAADVALNCC
jgi:hypothetical protein